MHTITSPSTEVAYLLRVPSPIGRIELTSDGEHITGLAIENAGALPHDHQAEASCDVLTHAAQQLSEYFEGKRRSFDLPLSTTGTEFQRSVWLQLGQLPFGAAVSYADIGRATGRPSAGRAVGGAVGANPIPIIVPCHRVLASNQRITGYSGGEGVPTKQWLLKHEGIAHK
ncbi:methylated-DNA--[protein]-cysteine S-methyltransferase [Salinibacterium sp. SWN248]|uniref:methylated-DNA--[protein]-cysteine S-methyltransferase n=1 Tax=Salinibacterium sp. SWN248 TaxID=2792056 RepID=UPI0018CEE66D|nr:methylated-DNA--[protein]-cysteine S-methyltransferase [Salinibacterium sp. SWN248]MBH0025215.1 methylated-DNA--[protein]-cysteine S-methyltransferase [Salinibacterium sp. SWN248]